MSYQALYRKYRSSNFDELVGQEAIKRTLLNSLKAGKTSHAYLFSGPRGTGKTSVARLFAKALNCTHGIGEICNECPSCIAISNGSHPDVIEIDAASNSGVDEVRNLIEQVKYGPIQSKHKVYIIDEVHMMTVNAFNALLKTLEEPPEYCVFILCTTEPYKLLPTILSRCQRYEFKKISDDDLKILLRRVLESESITYTEKALSIIVELANGGARDSLSLLDQVISYCGSDISEEAVFKMFGLTTEYERVQLIKAIAAKDTMSVLEMNENFVRRSIDLNRLVNELLLLLKDALIYSKTNDMKLVTSSDETSLQDIVSHIDDVELLEYVQTFLKCQNEFKTSSNISFLFEIYLLRLIDFGKNSEKSEAKQIVVNEEDKAIFTPKTPKIEEKEPQTATFVEKPVEVKPLPVVKPFEIKTGDSEVAPFTHDGRNIEIDNEEIIKIIILGKKEERKLLSNRWEQLQALLSNANEGPYASALTDCTPFLLTENNLILQTHFKNVIKDINCEENQDGLRRVIKKILGRNVCIYAISYDEASDIVTRFRDRQEIGKIPHKEEVQDNKLF